MGDAQSIQSIDARPGAKVPHRLPAQKNKNKKKKKKETGGSHIFIGAEGVKTFVVLQFVPFGINIGRDMEKV
ncbi:hypothetical protein Mp_5g06090 [Marchantia polymorpha subsp. ruderalis]|uniref:Uncharacterized protein n=2 Tax=Marchantia polymorpha TaxID=3197 RepID=A0AAF6BFG4_MARPO|nr:hypothetical protein MARPO_0027s0019 [Marchantia polymorpha]BBN10748.1 hypothetical protein Mp_5g06090 [Marchantia polymorpha subsp. ruderalis]|eukprot:PTQ42886.1 hypothetical protein MARPO_0027s0019 [Marchantia polymorpha]